MSECKGCDYEKYTHADECDCCIRNELYFDNYYNSHKAQEKSIKEMKLKKMRSLDRFICPK